MIARRFRAQEGVYSEIVPCQKAEAHTSDHEDRSAVVILSGRTGIGETRPDRSERRRKQKHFYSGVPGDMDLLTPEYCKMSASARTGNIGAGKSPREFGRADHHSPQVKGSGDAGGGGAGARGGLRRGGVGLAWGGIGGGERIPGVESHGDSINAKSPGVGSR